MSERGRHALVVLADVTGADEPAAWFEGLLSELDQLDMRAVGVALVSPPSTLPVPERWSATASLDAAAGQVFAAASARRAHLLFVHGSCRPTAARLMAMVGVVDDDPMIGCVHARFTTREGRLLSPVIGDTARRSMSPAVLSALPTFSFTADHVSACMLVPHRLTGNLEPRLEGWRSLDGLLLEYAVRVRRLGFRAVVANQALVTVPGGRAGACVPHVDDLRRIAQAYPEVDDAAGRSDQRRAIAKEHVASAIFDAPDSLLIDVRNLNAVINGTTKAILGLTSAWYARRPSLPTTLWVSPGAARFHQLAAKYPGWEVAAELPAGRPHAAAIRLSQPWHVSELLTLHDAAAVNSFLMLDTIAWDIGYTAPPGLDTVWQTAARTADCLMFISEFSRQQFLRRFPLGPGVRTAVVHLSLRPEDYDDPDRDASPTGGYWLVLGNAYDHKHVAPTVDTLARAFPMRELVVLGDRATPRGRRIRQLQSGSTSEPVLQGLYAAAEVVVFPSFYEGFGLPVVNALAYGRTVVARDSALMRELAAAYAGPGQLVLFQDEVEMVDQLTRLANGLPVEAVPFAPAGAVAHGWTAAATALDAEIAALVARPTSAARALRSFTAALLRDACT